MFNKALDAWKFRYLDLVCKDKTLISNRSSEPFYIMILQIIICFNLKTKHVQRVVQGYQDSFSKQLSS